MATEIAAASSAYADHLPVDELLGGVAAELPPEAGALDAAEWELRGVRTDDVDEHHPGLDPVGNAQRLIGIRREHGRAEAVRRVVRDRDGFVLGPDAVDDRDR